MTLWESQPGRLQLKPPLCLHSAGNRQISGTSRASAFSAETGDNSQRIKNVTRVDGSHVSGPELRCVGEHSRNTSFRKLLRRVPGLKQKLLTPDGSLGQPATMPSAVSELPAGRFVGKDREEGSIGHFCTFGGTQGVGRLEGKGQETKSWTSLTYNPQRLSGHWMGVLGFGCP